MKTVEQKYDVVVCGGGMAGFCAAVAAARQGAKTLLIQDRPVLGGNASSEIRVTVHGAANHHYGVRETGIIGEAMCAERRTNHLYPTENGWINSVHDLALYDIAQREPNLTLQLNTSVRDVILEDGSSGLASLNEWPAATAEKGYYWRPACSQGRRIRAVRAYVANAETELVITGTHFIDCSGDAVVAHWAGCEWRMGAESREETGEVHAASKASTDTMGNSIHIRCIDTGRPAPFVLPEWAVRYEDAAFFYEQGRIPNEPEGGYWWIEIGVPWHTIHDNETIRHELTRHALGVWDWMKNRDPVMKERCRNFALEFIGQVPGKRESRRVMGLHFLNENELQRREAFPDECAFGGWFIDLHTPGGLLAATSEPDSALGYDSSLKEVALKYIGPYGIPLRSLISKDVPNLAMAGRNISVTHAALGTVRVMATCALMGQAIGTAAALAIRTGKDLSSIAEDAPDAVQQQLMRDGCWLPHLRNTDPLDLARQASVSSSSQWLLQGLGVHEKVEDLNLRSFKWQADEGRSKSLSASLCQWLQLDGQRLDRLGLALRNTGGSAAKVEIIVRKVDSLWHYEVSGPEPIWRGTVDVPPGSEGLVWAETALRDFPAGCHRIELSGPQEVEWLVSGNRCHGVVGGHVIGSGRFHWNRLFGEFAFQTQPAQAVFGPEQAVSGVSRPADGSNLWMSDPSCCTPQWLELRWTAPVSIGALELTFPAQYVLETHWENPFYIAPHIAKDYEVLCEVEGQWRSVLTVRGNVEVRRQHRLPDTVGQITAVRLVVHGTHGSRSVGLAEIRCY